MKAVKYFSPEAKDKVYHKKDIMTTAVEVYLLNGILLFSFIIYLRKTYSCSWGFKESSRNFTK